MPPFDLILANLPYIPTGDIDRLPVAASFEPRLALDGGADGLSVVRRLVLCSARLARPGRHRAPRDRLRPGAGRGSGRGGWPANGAAKSSPTCRAGLDWPTSNGAPAARSPGSGAGRALMVEPRLPVRLIALDIDGTLVGEDLVLGERTVAAVAEARRRDIAVSLVTGRMATSARAFRRSVWA